MHSDFIIIYFYLTNSNLKSDIINNNNQNYMKYLKGK